MLANQQASALTGKGTYMLQESETKHKTRGGWVELPSGKLVNIDKLVEVRRANDLDNKPCVRAILGHGDWRDYYETDGVALLDAIRGYEE